MTPEQFEQWLSRAQDLFPGVRNYFDKANDANAVKRKWAEIITPFDYQDAKLAIDRMYEGDVEQPRSMSELPRVLKSLLRRGGGTSPATEAVYCRCQNPECGRRFKIARVCYWCKSENWSIERECRYCEDIGVVVIWSLEAMQRIQKAINEDDAYEPLHYETESVRCICERGNAKRFPKLVFNPNCMCPSAEPLRPFVENAMGVGAARTAGFDAFNEAGQEELF